MHDEDGHQIVGADSGRWCIHSNVEFKWLSSEEDRWLNSGGCNRDGWAGWYKTKQEALDRLTRYKNGLSPKGITVIGGE